jgi:hypothetical protein
VVITDLNMPRLGGIDTIAAIQKLNPKVRVIVITGAATTTETPAIKQLNVSHFLKKPFDAALLFKTLNAILHPD